ncbi:MAG: protein-L-isoaspartate(D-aspartate) O-methyltransferase [Thermoanaerobaculia bacterium]|nr:protein-L-isoaspartate(D-aspartate) O-methyltransferase [Thermoanaerobaculia bacterium]
MYYQRKRTQHDTRQRTAASGFGDTPRMGVVVYLLVGIALSATAVVAAQGESFETLRRDMVDLQVRQRGIQEPGVLEAMELVPRHLFVPPSLKREAYDDRPLPIAPGQTLSQAYVSARMIALLELDGDERVLEIGTGSGYDAAVLSRLAEEVFTIEIEPGLGESARSKLQSLGYENVHVRIGDGYRGWPEKSPFDAILVTTAPERIPEPLFDQLAPGGRMVIAVGYSLHQDLQVVTKSRGGDREVRRVSLISLAPMTGEVTEQNDDGGPGGY